MVLSTSVRADVVSDQTAAIVVAPKILVDTARGIDTLIQLSNASRTPIVMQCFYVNATPACGTGTGNCITNQRFASLSQCEPFSACIPQWQETDFRIVLTESQPVAWLASQGAVDCRRIENPPDNDPSNNVPCFPLDGIFRLGRGGQSNAGSSVPPVGQDPFIGELKCVAIDPDSDAPVPRNDIHGHVTIVGDGVGGGADLAGYNVIGIQAMGVCRTGPAEGGGCREDSDCPESQCDFFNDGDKTLVLGRPGDEGVEYNGCPNILILDHFFDFAVDPVTQEPVTTDLTLVPCSQDFLRQEVFATTVQFLVFNEFEQRFSTSRRVECYREIQLSNIDTATNDRSIFSAQVAGTLTGQTRIRGVVGNRPEYGNTLLGVAEEYRRSGIAAFNLHAQGVRPQKDYIYLP
jgi:hypothetical protein